MHAHVASRSAGASLYRRNVQRGDAPLGKIWYNRRVFWRTLLAQARTPRASVTNEALSTVAEPALVARARAGDGAAITTLYLRYAPLIYRYAYQRTGERTLAEDIQSEVFVRMLEALPGYEERGRPFVAWLFRIAHARVIDCYRDQARQAGIATLQQPTIPGPEVLVEHADVCAALDLALAGLTPLQRRVVWLHYHEHMSLCHIAASMACTAESVRAVHLRALRRMARTLTPMVY